MITENDMYFLHIACDESFKSEHKKVHIGACVVYRGIVTSTGHNQLKSHPEQKKYDIYRPYFSDKSFLHAEMAALIGIKKRGGKVLYVARLSKCGGFFRNCKPCEACMKKAIDLGIQRIVHTIDFGVKEIIL